MTTYTQAELTALKQAVARGIKSVTYDGQTVQYRSIDEMQQAIAMIERDLAPARRERQTRTHPTERGFR